MSFDRPSVAQTTKHDDIPPNAADHLIAHVILPYLRKHPRLPEPLPIRPEEAADWWLSQMQDPEQPHETYRAAVAATGGAGGTRWETGYANRCAQAMRRFLYALTDEQRQAVVKVVQSGTSYRGDDWDLIVAIVNQRKRCEDMGFDQFRQSVARRARMAFRPMP